MINVLFAGGPERWPSYDGPLQEALAKAGLDARVAPQALPEDVDYIVYAPNPDLTDFAPFTKTRLVQSLWAGVESIVTNPSLTQPLARMVDQGLREGMVEWVTGHVLRHHLGTDRHIVNPGHAWLPEPPSLARNRTVAILGLGALGRACAEALSALNFQVLGWSRSAKEVPGVTCASGSDGLERVLERAEILVLLLPLTAQTEDLLDAQALARMPEGAVILNPGRGPLIDDTALLQALSSGQISHATLDVFRQEPLPAGDPYWAHPQVTVTPHIASETRVETAVEVVAENLRRVEAGAPPLYLVDRGVGY